MSLLASKNRTPVGAKTYDFRDRRSAATKPMAKTDMVAGSGTTFSLTSSKFIWLPPTFTNRAVICWPINGSLTEALYVTLKGVNELGAIEV